MYCNSDKWYEDQINKQQQIIDKNIAKIEELQKPANEIKAKLEVLQQEIKQLEILKQQN